MLSTKSMSLMEAQPYSLAFRKQDPKFNGLLWSYHWLQMSMYDALMQGGAPLEEKARVDSTVARFFAMLESAPSPDLNIHGHPGRGAPPLFSARYPEAANIFDNLHALHDVVSDILASDIVPRAKKREAIPQAAAACHRGNDDERYFRRFVRATT